MPHSAPLDPHFTERPVRVSNEEPADNGFLDAVSAAPHIQALRPREVHGAGARRPNRVSHRVHGCDVPVVELVPPE
jgi:hypothetical protein